MQIFLTGAFGNVGRSTIAALLAQGDSVRTFDLPTPKNRRAAQQWGGKIIPTWGDLRNEDDLSAALRGDLDAVIHLGFVIPRLSVTGINSEDRPDFARSVNVGGTQTLIQALQSLAHKPRLVFASSFHVFGKTQHLPPRTVDEPPHPVEHYARHKVEAEGIVRASGLEWAILRLGAALPIRLILDPGMFDVPLANRIEFIHTRDAGSAFASAAHHPDIPGKTLLIGGGPRCQLVYRDVMARVLSATGIGSLPERYFARDPYSTDWMDTTQSQALLQYQQRTFEDYIQDLLQVLGPLRLAVRALRPVIRRWLVSHSPYGHAQKTVRPVNPPSPRHSRKSARLHS